MIVLGLAEDSIIIECSFFCCVRGRDRCLGQEEGHMNSVSFGVLRLICPLSLQNQTLGLAFESWLRKCCCSFSQV